MSSIRSPIPPAMADPIPLELKVTRLRHPALESGPASNHLYTESGDLLEFIPSNQAGILQDGLILPQSFGNIYVGEQFKCALALANAVYQPIHRVSVRAELQTNNKRLALLESNPSENTDMSGTFEPQRVASAILSHTLTDVGVHVIAITVTFDSPLSHAEKSFRKFFKFQVLNPFAVQCRISALPSLSAILVESQIQNAMQSPVTLESIDFRAQEGLKVVTDSSLPWHLNQNDTCSVVHRVSGVSSGHNSVTLGQIAITWRGAMSPSATICGPLLTFKPTPVGNREARIDVMLPEDAPPKFKLGSPVKLQFIVTNLSPSPLELQLLTEQENDLALVPCGCIRTELPSLNPQQQHTMNLNFLPLRTGIHFVRGLKFQNKGTKAVYEPKSTPSMLIY